MTTTVIDDLAVVDVRDLASNGSGVAELPDGRIVFVPRAAPGDRLRVRLVRVKRRWAEARIEETVEAAPTRVEPQCPLYDRCGGCTMQHLLYDEQVHWKGRFVADALERIGKLAVAPPPVVASPVQSRYRNRITYTLRRLRGGRVIAGFHALGRPSHVLDVRGECILPEPGLGAAWTALRAGWGPGARRLPAGGRLRLTLRKSESGIALIVGGGGGEWSARELAEEVGVISSVWHRPAGAERAALLHGAAVQELWGKDRLTLLGDVFLQVNRSAAEPLERHVIERSGSPKTAIDAYCGVGLYGRALARAGACVTGIEMSPDALGSFEGAIADYRVLRGRVEDRLPDALPAQLLILNPPRTGLVHTVPDHIMASPPERIIYVSCDPATLARDLARLTSVYSLVELQAFDLFPQTAHVETVAVLERNGHA